MFRGEGRVDQREPSPQGSRVERVWREKQARAETNAVENKVGGRGRKEGTVIQREKKKIGVVTRVRGEGIV